MRILSLVPVLAVAACVESSSPTDVMAGRANMAQVINQKTEVFAMPTAACNGEVVDLSGTVHTKFDLDFTHNGLRVSFSSVYKLEGVGSETGATYHGTESTSQRGIVNGDNSVQSDDVTIHLVAQGDVPNTTIVMKVKTTVVDGEIKQEHILTKTICK